MQAFYYGTWLLELVSLISLLAVYRSNKRVIRDLKHLPMVKDKWLRAFLQEHQKIVNENGSIHNPAVYLTRRMRGRKIGPITLRQMKGVFWLTFALSFLCAGTGLFFLRRTGLAAITFPFVDKVFKSQSLLIATAVGAGVILLLLRALLSMGYQEEVLETNLLDYMENQDAGKGKVVVMEVGRQKRFVRKPKEAKTARVKQKRKLFGRKEKKQQEQKLQEQRLMLQKERASKEIKEREKEQTAEKVEERIREAAATDERYGHLLNKEEEAIVKDVIKEFLS